MAKKASRKKKSTSGTSQKKDAKAFVDHLAKNKVLRGKLKKGWEDVISAGKKQGYKFTRQELRTHFKKRYAVGKLMKEDEPDTCICI
jgi:predicted ribosomally synthesized peptide with nif11-like leader